MAEPQITLYRDTNFGGRAVTLSTCGSQISGSITTSMTRHPQFVSQAGFGWSTTTPILREHATFYVLASIAPLINGAATMIPSRQ